MYYTTNEASRRIVKDADAAVFRARGQGPVGPRPRYGCPVVVLPPSARPGASGLNAQIAISLNNEPTSLPIGPGPTQAVAHHNKMMPRSAAILAVSFARTDAKILTPPDAEASPIRRIGRLCCASRAISNIRTLKRPIGAVLALPSYRFRLLVVRMYTPRRGNRRASRARNIRHIRADASIPEVYQHVLRQSVLRKPGGPIVFLKPGAQISALATGHVEGAFCIAELPAPYL